MAATRDPGVNVNVLLGRDAMDPLSGTSMLTAVPVRVRAADPDAASTAAPAGIA